MKGFFRLKNPSSWRRISMATWKAPNDPTVYGSLALDFSNAQEFLKKLNVNLETKITVTHFVAKGVALTLKHFPDLNGIIRWGGIYLRKSVDIFLQVAVAGAGEERADLSGVKIEHCDEKTLRQIAQELREKSQRIRNKKDPQFQSTLKLLQYMPSWALKWAIRFMGFFLYNLGWHSKRLGLPEDPFGSAMVTSVGSMDLPAAFVPLAPMSRVPFIVCVGSVTDKPWAIDGQVVVRPILDLGITFDHRFMDGATASRMVKYFKDLVENPQKYFSTEI